MPAKHTFYYTCVGVIINWVIFQRFHALLTCARFVGFNHREVFQMFREYFYIFSIYSRYLFRFFLYPLCCNFDIDTFLIPLCVYVCVYVCMCLHFVLIRIFADMQNFNHASHVYPLAIVCVHQAKCWLRLKGLFPSAFNESVCCILTKRPTPIHLDFLLFSFFFFARLIFKEPSIYQVSFPQQTGISINASSTMKNTTSPCSGWIGLF